MPNLRACVLALVPVAALALVGCGGSSSNESTNGGDGGTTTAVDHDATVTGTGTGPGGGPVGDGSTGSGDTGTGTGSGGDDGATPADASAACTKAADCPLSGICNPSGECAAPTCTDGVKNQNETDIDCGGMCPACDALKHCAVPGDCTSGVCTGMICQAPTDMDGVKNGNETGVDCGGMGNPKCATGQGCDAPTDCTTDVCTANLCVANSCTDGVQNGHETDVDCGGFDCPRCPDAEMCLLASDCVDGVCKTTTTMGLRCAPPSYTDGVKNGSETDVDCGGTGDPTLHGCPPTDSCIADTDCTSDGCDYTKHCAIHRSCAGTKSGQRYGADTCGAGGAGGIGVAAWESCCSTIDVTVTEGTPAVKNTVHLDKYKVTAGRMRQFLESVNGNVRSFVQTARTAGQIPVMPVIASNPAKTTVLPPAWDKYLPTSMAGDATETPDCDQSGWNASTNSPTRSAT